MDKSEVIWGLVLGKDREISEGLVGGTTVDSVDKDGVEEECIHVCKDSRVFIQASEDRCCIAGELTVSVECVRPGKMH